MTAPHPIRAFGQVIYRYVGRRGALLLILAVMDLGYGSALVVTATVPYKIVRAVWWPASVGNVSGVSTLIWGWVWVVAAVFLLTGVPRHWPDRWQFAVAVALKTWWALAAMLFFAATQSVGAWGPAVIYAGIAAMVLMASGWQDVRITERRPGPNS